MNIDATGLWRCTQYAFAPNLLHFCGPEKQNDLLGYLHLRKADQGLVEIINQFETLYPYLQLIAAENGLRDVFSQQVIEAYWLGNGLLNNCQLRPFARHLLEGLQLKKKLSAQKLNHLFKNFDNCIPHHTFHVLNIFCRTGHISLSHTISTMDNCRISWGKIIKFSNSNPPAGRAGFQFSKIRKKQPEDRVLVLTRPLIYENSQLQLGRAKVKDIYKGFIDCKEGDWVSVHWGWACEILTQRQVENLKYYTELAIRLANRI